MSKEKEITITTFGLVVVVFYLLSYVVQPDNIFFGWLLAGIIAGISYMLMKL